MKTQKPDCFKIKEVQINKALEKVKNKLQQFTDEAAKIPDKWTDADREHFKDWNLFHDLQYRLEQRLWHNWSSFKDWHWDNFGFNTYP